MVGSLGCWSQGSGGVLGLLRLLGCWAVGVAGARLVVGLLGLLEPG